MTKLVIGQKRVRHLRTRGGNKKLRALRLDSGNFSWGSEGIARKTRIMNVVYNAAGNELVRTNTLVKGAVVEIDSTPYRSWYYKWYGITLGKDDVSTLKAPKKRTVEVHVDDKRGKKGAAKKEADRKATLRRKAAKIPKNRLKNWASRSRTRSLETGLENQLTSGSGRMLARLASRPGQIGRADGYILEGRELEFYARKLDKKRKTKK
jgi:small subunit ribosomal protein S8e